MPAHHTGGCLCGAIRYTVSAPISELRACHCTNCQKASGSGGSVNAMLKSADFMALRAGTLDDSSGMKISGNIWTKSARPWGFIDPSTQQHPGQPDAPPAR